MQIILNIHPNESRDIFFRQCADNLFCLFASLISSRFESSIIQNQLLQPTGARHDSKDLLAHICRLKTQSHQTH